MLVWFFTTLGTAIVLATGLAIFLRDPARLHFRRLLFRVWNVSMAALSQTTLSFILYSIFAPIGAFFLTLLLLRKLRPQGDSMEQIKESLISAAVGLAIPLAIVICVFGWKSGETIYKDHQTITSAPTSGTQLKPSLRSEMLGIYLGPAKVEVGGTVLVAVVRIKNGGAPSIISRIWLSAEVHGEKYEGALLYPTPTMTLFNADGKTSKTFYIQDLLPTKASVEPIPTGGATFGFVPVELSVSPDKVRDAATVVELKIEDVTGTVSTERVPFSVAMNAGPDMGVPLPGVK
jgi:hypothetical protein